jgi:hypothetical protein
MLGNVIKSVRNLINLGYMRFTKAIRRFNKSQHQLTSTTYQNRYPAIFEELRKHQPDGLGISILSFGCSTGEECVSIRSYFPKARIVGLDINTANLRRARAKKTDDRMTFQYSDEKNLKQFGPYNIILCMSVLCRWNDTEFVNDCSEIYPFRRFNEIVKDLSNNLQDGGFMVIYNSNFRFEDSEIGSKFSTVLTPSIEDSGFVHKFSQNNLKVLDKHKSVIFQKSKSSA